MESARDTSLGKSQSRRRRLPCNGNSKGSLSAISLGLTLASATEERGRVYRIAAPEPA
jgi:hypothetical protein